jgi:hypothetical protein
MLQANYLEHVARIVSANLPSNRCKVHRQRLSAGRKRNTCRDSIEPWHVSEALRAHFAWMTFAMEKDVAPNPIHVSLLGSDRIVFYAQMPPNAVE